MSDVDTVHMFWHGGELPPLGRACMRSFVARGHRLRVHAYRPLALPDGVERADARDVFGETDPLYRLCAPGSITAFADCFRYRLLMEHGGWWMDTDVYCLAGTLPPEARAWAEQESGLINNAILKFAPGDPLAARLAELARDRAKPGLRWGTIGPDLMTEVLAGADGVEPARARPRFYPLHWREAHFLWLPEKREAVERRVASADFLHCWAQALENMGIDPWREPPRGSYLEGMLRGVPGARPLTPWRRFQTRRTIRRHVREVLAGATQDDAARTDGNGPAVGGRTFERAMTWLRREVVMPLRAARLGLRLPPGRLDRVQHRVDTDRMFFIERAQRHGPIFKALVNNSYTTCVVGHALGARLIAKHETRLGGYTVDLEGLFPIGALRGMSGETHRKYRRQFLHAVQATPLEAHAREVEDAMRSALRAIAEVPGPVAGDELRDRLRRLSTTVMLRVLYGVDAGTPESDALEAHYRRFGPKAPVSKIDAPHAAAFAEISGCLHTKAAAARGPAGEEVPPCVLRYMARSGEADATTMGNLAYLLEAAHFDVYSLWHWILKFVSAHAGVQAAYRAQQGAAGRKAYAEAIVKETLRMEQSELLYWRVQEHIAFEGYLIPRGTTLRVCIWEGHKDAAAFPEPFQFRPERFLGARHGLDAYAPFGLGQRRCLGADLTVALSAVFVQTMLDEYDAERAADDAPVKGPYHWQPAPEFSVRLRPRVMRD
jgi:cytochrome P450